MLFRHLDGAVADFLPFRELSDSIFLTGAQRRRVYRIAQIGETFLDHHDFSQEKPLVPPDPFSDLR